MTAGSASESSAKNTAESVGSQCWPVCTTISSIPASRSARESGADLMNWGRLPTTVSSLTMSSPAKGSEPRTVRA